MLVGRVALIHGTAADLGISKYNGVSSYLSARVGGRSFKTESTQIKFLIKIHKTVYRDASFRLSPDKTRRWYVTFSAYRDTVQLASSQTSRWFMCCDAGAHTHRSVRCLAPRQQFWLSWSVTRSLARFFCKGGTDSSLLTFYRFAIHQPLYRRLGVPVGSTHQPAILARGQNEVLGFIQPVWSSFKIHQCTSYECSNTASSKIPSPLLPAELRQRKHRPLEWASLGAVRVTSPLPPFFGHTKPQPFISVKLC